jgi:beta-lactamase regulating signal transducer with metallopeptidase domain
MILEHLLVHAFRGALLFGLALLAMPLLKRAPAAARRLVLTCALTSALVLPLVSSLLPSFEVRTPQALAELRVHVVAEPATENSPALPTATLSVASKTPFVSVSVPRITVRSVALTIWSVGVVGVLGRLVVGLMKARAMVRRSHAADAWRDAIKAAARLTGIKANVRVTDALDAPAVTGVVSPVVLVPVTSARWSDARKRAVLLHELAHLRRHDCLTHVVAQLACALHWFNPLAWLALRQLLVERELAADEAVLDAGTMASSYAEDLLAIATVERARPVPSTAMAMAARSTLALRIAALCTAPRARNIFSRRASALVISGAALVLFTVACASPSLSTPDAPHGASPAAEAIATATIDPGFQAIADEELDRALADWQAPAGTILMLEPSTGAIVASAGRSAGARFDVAVRSAYVTGSTLKPLTIAAALEEGVVSVNDRFDVGGERSYGGSHVLHDACDKGPQTLAGMLAVSSNVGVSRVFDKLGGDRLGGWLRRFHLGAAPALEGAVTGAIPAHVDDGSFDGAVLAIGEGLAASPVQLAAAYSVFANDGVYVAPTRSRRSGAPARESLVKPETARAVLAMMEGVVESEHGTGGAAHLDGVRVAGKTGTAEWTKADGTDGSYASFVGIVPADRPRFIILVGVESPKGKAPGGKVAAPVFARVAKRALAR